MCNVFEGKKNFMTPLLSPIERFIYRLIQVDEKEEMNWKKYAYSLIVFNIISIKFLFLLQLLQGVLQLNPQGFPGVRWDTALNTAISFVTNTNWQSYAGETTMSYLTQMLGLAVQNFVSVAAVIATILVFIRGFTRKNMENLGNFWVDMTRSVLFILFQLSVLLSIIFVSQGVVQTFDPYATIQTLEGSTQTIPLGPAASQVA